MPQFWPVGNWRRRPVPRHLLFKKQSVTPDPEKLEGTR
jgi:hypothetical protein